MTAPTDWKAAAYAICRPAFYPSDAALLADATARDDAILRENAKQAVRERHARLLAPLGALCTCDTCSDVEDA
jgi:hypothetical protein